MKICYMLVGGVGPGFSQEMDPTATIAALADQISASHFVVGDELEVAAVDASEHERSRLMLGELGVLDQLALTPLEATAILGAVFDEEAHSTLHVLVLDQRIKAALPVLRLLDPDGVTRWYNLHDHFTARKMTKRQWDFFDEDDRVPPDAIAPRLAAVDARPYTQDRRALPDPCLRTLHEYMQKCPLPAVREDDQLEAEMFVGTLLLMIAQFAENTHVVMDAVTQCDRVDSGIHFEFTVFRPHKRLSLVQKKRNSFDEARARVCEGCQCVKRVERFDVVYGFATDFVQWDLFRFGRDLTQRDSVTLTTGSRGLAYEPFRDLCNMIYGVLTCSDAD